MTPTHRAAKCECMVHDHSDPRGVCLCECHDTPPRPPEEKVCPRCFKQHANKTKYCYLHEPPEGKLKLVPHDDDNGIGGYFDIEDENGSIVRVNGSRWHKVVNSVSLNHAELIVKAVNLHAKLVEALEAEHLNIINLRDDIDWPTHLKVKGCRTCALLKEAKK